MTWEQIKGLNDAGFEIGNHTRNHTGAGGQPSDQFSADVEYIEKKCEEFGIPRPISFCYPGYQTSQVALKVLADRGYKYARAGGARAFVLGQDNPLTLPQAFDGKPGSTLEQFKAAVAKAKQGEIAVMTFHGVPDIKHPWVNTTPEMFESYMNYLKEQGCAVLSLRDCEIAGGRCVFRKRRRALRASSGCRRRVRRSCCVCRRRNKRGRLSRPCRRRA